MAQLSVDGGGSSENKSSERKGPNDSNSSNTAETKEHNSTEHLKSDGDTRSHRATGGNSSSNLSERATNPSNELKDSERKGSFYSRDEKTPFSILDPERKSNYHLLDNQNENKSRFSLGVDYKNLGGGERASGWTDSDSMSLAEQAEFIKDFIGGTLDFAKEFANVMLFGKEDKEAHFTANCEATKRGLGGEYAAEGLSNYKEASDYPRNLKSMTERAALKDYDDDMKANRAGREAGKAGERCYDAYQKNKNNFW